MLEDFLTGEPVKNTPKERVRQRIVRALSMEYAISLEDISFDFPVPVKGEATGRPKTRKVEIAIFSHKAPHDLEHLRRVVLCRPEPVLGRKSAVKIRDHDQAGKDLEELKAVMSAVAPCEHGLWTNGLDFFFLLKEVTRSGVEFYPRADWPVAETLKVPPSSTAEDYMRRADPDMLRIAFRRCHNYIHGNEGMPKDAAFWQFLYLTFSKMQDEQESGGSRRFIALPSEPYTTEGRRNIRSRIEPLFAEVRERYGPDSDSPIFRGNEEITLSDAALAFLVAELQRYDFLRTDIDAKGLAYQELVGANLRGDRGQYFTPRDAIRLMVEMLDPREGDRVMDPSCGTGGFLTETLNYLLRTWRGQEGHKPEVGRRRRDHQERLKAYADASLFGADFDPFLVRATSMNLLMMTGTTGRVFHMDSLAFPESHLPGNALACKRAPLGSMDLVLTNPPFGADIPITDPHILDHFKDGIARSWRKDKSGAWQPGAARMNTVAPELLFIQRSVEWLKDGGRLGIVLPSGILSNPGDAPIRRWILENCWVLAAVDLPVETFVVEANVNVYTSLLFLKKKSQTEKDADRARGELDYPVFMAVAEKVGYDRRGNRLYKRRPDGELVHEEIEIPEYRVEDGELREKRRIRKVPIVDNDLPAIAERYRVFRHANPEPGERLTTVGG
jgi:type I restriction enzyme M protein